MHLSIEDHLTEMTADLMALEKNSPFLVRLFTRKAGVWTDITALCQDLGHCTDQIESVQQQLPGTLQVTWLAYPNAAHGRGYCVIIFFAEEVPWSNVALYNKAWFSRGLGQRPSVVK
jgi:hypothetical protein